MQTSSFQFKKPVLIYSNFRLNAVPQNPSSKSAFQLKVKITRCNLDTGTAVVVLDLSIGKKQKNSPFIYHGAMMAEFKWDTETVSYAVLGKMLSQNAPALILSYFRPIVSHITAEAGLEPYQIPFIDFTKEDGKESG